MQTSFRTGIADDHQFVCAGLCPAFENPDVVDVRRFDVVAEASKRHVAIKAVKSERPDLLFLGISMPQYSGPEILADIRRLSPDTRVVVLTAFNKVDFDEARLCGTTVARV